MSAYQPGPTPGPHDPGKTLGKVGMILAIIPCTSFIGLILSIVGFVQSRKVGIRNQNAFVGIIVGAAWQVLSIILNATGVVANMMTGVN